MGMTITQAAKELKVNQKTVRRRLKTGRLTGQLISGKWLIDLDSIRTSQQSKAIKVNRVKDLVSIPRREYESVLLRIGQLEAERLNLLDHQQTAQALKDELQRVKAELVNLKEQQQQRKQQSIFRRVKNAIFPMREV